MKRLFILIVFVSGLALMTEIARELYFFFIPNSVEEETKLILIEPGPFKKTAEFLAREGLIRHPKQLEFMARILRMSSKVRIGEYEVKTNMSPFEIMKIITSGKSVLHRVNIPEGFNLDQIAEELGQKHLVDPKEFVRLTRDPRVAALYGIKEKTLEGYLFPDTYSFTRFTGERAIIKTMVDRFKEVYDREIKFGAEQQKKSIHDVVTLASIIEKETGAPEERPIISSVFFNRLKLNMPLQSDPTVIYGKTGDKKNITKADLTTPTAYNTYTRKGLPIGPICNPGREAMIAVLEPAQTKYLFFVSRNDGTHFFSGNFYEHNQAVKKYQVDPAGRKGKSWRDRLKKKQKSSTALN